MPAAYSLDVVDTDGAYVLCIGFAVIRAEDLNGEPLSPEQTARKNITEIGSIISHLPGANTETVHSIPRLIECLAAINMEPAIVRTGGQIPLSKLSRRRAYQALAKAGLI